MTATGSIPRSDRIDPLKHFAIALVRAFATHWHVVIPMLLASITFAAGLSMYPRLMVASDALGYSVSAMHLAWHGVLSYQLSWDPNAPVAANAIITPGYPAFLAIFYFFGSRAGSAADAVRVIHPFILGAQYLLAVGTVAMIAACGDLVRGRWLALSSGTLAALYLPFGWAASLALSETLGTFLVCVQLLVATLILRRDRDPDRRMLFLFGVATGLVVLVRPVYVVWAIVPVALLSARRAIPLRQLARLAVFAMLGFVLIMGPWWVRNAISLHQLVLLRTNAGSPMLAAAGGYPLSTEEQGVFDGAKARGEDAEAVIANVRLSREWRAGPLQFVLKRANLAKEVVAWPFFAPNSIYWVENNMPTAGPWIRFGSPATAPPGALQRAEGWMVTYQKVLLVLALVGLCFARRWPALVVIATLPAYTVLVHSATLFIDRYFFPAMPAVIVLAGAGVTGIAVLFARGTHAARVRWFSSEAETAE